MERSVRQFAALHDTTLLETYENARGNFLATAQRMGTFRLDTEQTSQLRALKQREVEINTSVEAARQSGCVQVLTKDLQAGAVIGGERVVNPFEGVPKTRAAKRRWIDVNLDATDLLS